MPDWDWILSPTWAYIILGLIILRLVLFLISRPWRKSYHDTYDDGFGEGWLLADEDTYDDS